MISPNQTHIRTKSDRVLNVFYLHDVPQQHTRTFGPRTTSTVYLVVCVVEYDTGRIDDLQPALELNRLERLGVSWC